MSSSRAGRPLLLYTGGPLPSGGGGCARPVGAEPRPSQVAWKPPSAPATHTEGNSFIFGAATGTVARSLRLWFTSGWDGPVALWAGINKQRAFCPDSRSPKVNQSNSVSVDWRAGGSAACCWAVSQVLTCKLCLEFGSGTCRSEISKAWWISDIKSIRGGRACRAALTMLCVSAQCCAMSVKAWVSDEQNLHTSKVI